MNSKTNTKPIKKCEPLAQLLQEKLEEHIVDINLQIEDIQILDVSQEPVVQDDYRTIETVHVNVDSPQAVQNYKMGRLPNLIRDLIREVGQRIPHRKMTVLIDVAQTKNKITIPHFTMIYRGAYDPKLQAPLQCMVCNQTFEERQEFIMHKRLHFTNSKFKCLICKKTFSYLNTLKQHNLMHTSDSQYDCDICDKTFAQKNKLATHRRAHKGEVYKCLHCPETFKNLVNYRKHWDFHSSERPFRCKLCQRSYARQSDFNRHIKTKSHLSKVELTKAQNEENENNTGGKKKKMPSQIGTENSV